MICQALLTIVIAYSYSDVMSSVLNKPASGLLIPHACQHFSPSRSRRLFIFVPQPHWAYWFLPHGSVLNHYNDILVDRQMEKHSHTDTTNGTSILPSEVTNLGGWNHCIKRHFVKCGHLEKSVFSCGPEI